MKNIKIAFWLVLTSCAGAKESPPLPDAGSVHINLVLSADPISTAQVAQADGFLYMAAGDEVEVAVNDPDYDLRDADIDWRVAPDFSFEITQYDSGSRVARIRAVDDPLSFGGVEPSAELTVHVKDQAGNEGELKTRIVSVVNLNGYWQGEIPGVEYDWRLNVYQRGKTVVIGDFGRGRRYDGVVNGVFVEFTSKGKTYLEQFIGTFTTPNGLYGFHNIETDSCLQIWSLVR